MQNKQNEQQEGDLPAGLSNPARRALAGIGVWRLAQLTEITEAKIKRLHGMGPKGIEQLRHALAAKGLTFAGG